MTEYKERLLNSANELTSIVQRKVDAILSLSADELELKSLIEILKTVEQSAKLLQILEENEKEKDNGIIADILREYKEVTSDD